MMTSKKPHYTRSSPSSNKSEIVDIGDAGKNFLEAINAYLGVLGLIDFWGTVNKKMTLPLGHGGGGGHAASTAAAPAARCSLRRRILKTGKKRQSEKRPQATRKRANGASARMPVADGRKDVAAAWPSRP